MDKAQLLYKYQLYSFKRFPNFLKYAWKHSKLIINDLGKKNNFLIFLDMIWCNLRYGAMDSRDYWLFDFYKKSSHERNAYFTKRRYFKLIKSFDFPTFSNLMIKGNAYREYADFIHRDWFIVDSTTDEKNIRDFIAKHGSIIVKPNTGEQGHGIFKAGIEDVNKIKELVSKDSSYILEEVVENCDEIKEINPSSLNTFRVYTFTDKGGRPHILAIMLRVGSVGCEVDNWGSGGVGYSFDVESGVCVGYGYDKKHHKFIFHPGSNFKMAGFEIPKYKELKKFVESLAKHNSDTIYVGWDIAAAPNGFELIEMNFPGGHDFLQAFGTPAYTTIKKYLNE